MPAGKKHIALLTTWYPPVEGVAVNRMVSFTRYLDHEKYHLTVITIEEGNAPAHEPTSFGAIYRLKNRPVLPLFPEQKSDPSWLHKMKIAWKLIVRKLQPMMYQDWQKRATSMLEDLHRARPIHLVISSYAPAEAHLAAADFLDRHKDIRWIADMRDEMSDHPYLPAGDISILEKVEQRIQARADAVTTVSQPILDGFKARMPKLRHFEEIKNGFDHQLSALPPFNPVFTMVYAGNFYGIRKPDTFLKALEEFHRNTGLEFRLKFIGTYNNFGLPDSLRPFCDFLPFLPYQEMVGELLKADALVFIEPTTRRKGVFTGKVFDYISAKRPIIAICDQQDVAAGLIKETRSGFLADFNDHQGILQSIESAVELWKNKKQLDTDDAKVAQLHRQLQVKKLQTLIETILPG